MDVLGLGDSLATSNTPRLGLSQPDDTELMRDPNLDRDWNTPMDNLDAAAGSLQCTSGTRPVSPYVGQLIRESDTSRMLIWDGANWIVYATKDCGWQLTGLTTLTPASGTPLVLNGWSVQDTYNCSVVSNGVEVNTPGLYFAAINVRWQTRAQNTLNFNRILFLEHVTAGGSPVPISGRNNGTSGNTPHATVDHTYKCASGWFMCDAVGQRIRPVVFQDSGGAYNLVATDSWFVGALVAPLETY